MKVSADKEEKAERELIGDRRDSLGGTLQDFDDDMLIGNIKEDYHSVKFK